LGKRRKARELVLQFLYQIDMNKVGPFREGRIRGKEADMLPEAAEVNHPNHDLEVEISSFWENFKTDEDVKSFFRQLAGGVLKNREEIDALIDGASLNWRLSRMAVVDRNILRFSVYELLYLSDIPPSVTINEAVEIAKRYGSEESPSFINGILDKISNNHKKERPVQE
jgi:transcription antitermination protein NusB